MNTKRFLTFILTNFGPTIAFLAVNRWYGLKAAILAALGVALVEIVLAIASKRRPTLFFGFSVAMTLVFGAVDLYATNPFLFKYEAAVMAVLFGCYFGGTILIGKPVIAELAAQTLSPERLADPNVRRYLTLLTGIWTGYFFLKAALYAYVANAYSLEEAVAIRAVFGNASLAALLLGERLFRSRLVELLKRVGFFGRAVLVS